MSILRLPQLAVSAKLLCLLMVVMCGAVPSMVVRSVKLFSESSSKFVRINDSGQVYAADDRAGDDYLNLTIATIDFTRLTIFSEQTQRYICFNRRWKLIGMAKNEKATKPEKRNPRELRRCQFIEGMEDRGYSTYRSIKNESHYLAFNVRGKPVKRHPISGYSKKCTNFLKIGNETFNIAAHNKKKSNGNPPDYLYYTSQQARPHKKRHKHGKARK